MTIVTGDCLSLDAVVRVRLTGWGLETWRRYYEPERIIVGMGRTPAPKPETDENGWVTFSLWELVDIFGRFLRPDREKFGQYQFEDNNHIEFT